MSLVEYAGHSKLRSSKTSACLVSVCVVVAILMPLESLRALKVQCARGGGHVFIQRHDPGSGNSRGLGGWCGSETSTKTGYQVLYMVITVLK